MKTSGADNPHTLYCSFCGKSQHEVRKLVAGPTVYICNECAELVTEVIREELNAERGFDHFDTIYDGQTP